MIVTLTRGQELQAHIDFTNEDNPIITNVKAQGVDITDALLEYGANFELLMEDVKKVITNQKVKPDGQ